MRPLAVHVQVCFYIFSFYLLSCGFIFRIKIRFVARLQLNYTATRTTSKVDELAVSYNYLFCVSTGPRLLFICLSFTFSGVNFNSIEDDTQITVLCKVIYSAEKHMGEPQCTHYNPDGIHAYTHIDSVV